MSLSRATYRMAFGAAAGLAVAYLGSPWAMVPIASGILWATNVMNDGKPSLTPEFYETAGTMAVVYFVVTKLL
jgi:hypothetical protein